jgi:hypothetical protein
VCSGKLAKAEPANVWLGKTSNQLVNGIRKMDAVAVTTLIKRRVLTIIKGAMF